MGCQFITRLHTHTHTFISRRWAGTHIRTWRTCTETYMCTENWKCEVPPHCPHPVFHTGSYLHNYLILHQTNLQSEWITVLFYSLKPQLLFTTNHNKNTFDSFGKSIICCWVLTISQRRWKIRFWIKSHFTVYIHQRVVWPQRLCWVKNKFNRHGGTTLLAKCDFLTQWM